jgi:hypothetical protein
VEIVSLIKHRIAHKTFFRKLKNIARTSGALSKPNALRRLRKTLNIAMKNDDEICGAA